MITHRGFFRSVGERARYERRLAEILHEHLGRVPRMPFDGRCGSCFERALRDPCPRCRAANRRARRAEGWDGPPRDMPTRTPPRKEIRPMPPVPSDYKSSDTNPPSRNLKADNFELNTRWRLEIADVNIELMPAQGDSRPERKRLVLTFIGKEKGLVLNKTNQVFLEERLGDAPNRWIGASVVLLRSTTLYQGKPVPALKLIEALAPPPPVSPPPPPAAPAGEPGDDVPF